MPTGQRPRVNEAREFLEIAKDFKDPKEIIREALSNSWDAHAQNVSLKFDLVRMPGTSRKKIVVEISDDGEGMGYGERPQIGTSELQDFFNLGDSHKLHGSIGTKGHGTKIYYKSDNIVLDTWKNGKHVHAETEVPPWETLNLGRVPTYRYDETQAGGKGTNILVDGFKAKQKDFTSLDDLTQYILWYTVIGSFGHYFEIQRKMDVRLKPAKFSTEVTVPFGFSFPSDNTDISRGTDNYCKIFGPKTIACGRTEEGAEVEVNVIGAILGEGLRDLVPHTYDMMGLWLAKDFIRVERNNRLIEDAFHGQYFYRSMLIFANCQQFELTANRNNIRNDQEEYELAVEGIKQFLTDIHNADETCAYFETKKREDEAKKQEKKAKDQKTKADAYKAVLSRRLNEYGARPDLVAPNVEGAPLKEPTSEAETSLLLQAMISSRHSAIDFRIGEYKTSQGVDLLVQSITKGITSFAWAEIVVKLENLYQWPHDLEGIHKVICWELGRVRERQTLGDGREARLTKKQAGRYHLDVGTDSIEVYVLREIIQSKGYYSAQGGVCGTERNSAHVISGIEIIYSAADIPCLHTLKRSSRRHSGEVQLAGFI